MKAGLAECVVELEAATAQLAEELERHRWTAARELARRILSAGSKLHARLGLLSELEDDAQFVAEVDRALARERKTRPEAVEGDRPLPFPKAPRKRKGG